MLGVRCYYSRLEMKIWRLWKLKDFEPRCQKLKKKIFVYQSICTCAAGGGPLLDRQLRAQAWGRIWCTSGKVIQDAVWGMHCTLPWAICLHKWWCLLLLSLNYYCSSSSSFLSPEPWGRAFQKGQRRVQPRDRADSFHCRRKRCSAPCMCAVHSRSFCLSAPSLRLQE